MWLRELLILIYTHSWRVWGQVAKLKALVTRQTAQVKAFEKEKQTADSPPSSYVVSAPGSPVVVWVVNLLSVLLQILYSVLVPPAPSLGPEQSVLVTLQRWDVGAAPDAPGRLEVVSASKLLEWGRHALKSDVSDLWDMVYGPVA